MKVLGLVPARGGSREVPGKNLRLLGGRSLVGRTVDCALASGRLDRVLVSTDCEEIRRIGVDAGAEAPFLRPAEYSGDESPMIEVVLHALTELRAAGYEPDAVLLLQPTSPLRRVEHIERALDLLPGCDAVCSVVRIPKAWAPHRMMKLSEAGELEFLFPEAEAITRRQDAPSAYKRDGTIFLTRTGILVERRSFYGEHCRPMILPDAEALNIDTEEDWARAEALLGEVGR